MHHDFLNAEVRPGYAFSSYLDDVLSRYLPSPDERISHSSLTLQLKYGFSLSDSVPLGKLYPGVRQGVGIGATLFTHPRTTGIPTDIFIFQGAPIIKFNDRLSLDYEWNFGVSCGWKKSDGLTSRSNLIVGSALNAYINLGIGISWRITSGTDLSLGIGMTHYSNGNTSFPNPGVNLVGMRLGVTRRFGKLNCSTPFRGDTLWRRGHLLSYDLTAYGAWRRRVYRGGETPVLLKGHYGVAGLNFAPMFDLYKFFRAGISADFQWDASTDLKHYHISGNDTDEIQFTRPPFFSQMAVGASARAELVMPFFALNVGIGYNFLGPPEARTSYQMANLKLSLVKGLFLNIGYQLQDFKRQSNLRLGFGYTFRRLLTHW